MRRLSINSDSVRSLEEELDQAEASDDGDAHGFHTLQEMELLLKIAAPAVVVQFSVLAIFPQTASVVGRTLGTEALAGFSLGSLVGNLTCVSVMAGALTAADILMPRAWGGKKYEEMGFLAIRSVIIGSFFLMVPIIPLCTSMEWIFDRLGQDRDASFLASQWIRFFLIGVPSQLLFRVVQSFLNSQNQVYPMVFASVVASYLVHPILLKIIVPTMGENGSALAISLTQWTMIGLLYLYLCFRPVAKPETLPKFSMQSLIRALRPGPTLQYISLSLGGVLVLSEWWLWETVCFIVGTFGVVPLVVHSIAYNLVPLVFMPILGMGIGLTVRMGHIIAYDIVKAKLLAMWAMLVTVLFGAIVSTSLYAFRIEIALLFTDDMAVVEGCKAIWGKLSCYTFWRMAIIIFVFLWCVTLPAIVFFAVHRGGGLDAIWTILPISYSLMQVLLAGTYLTADWESIGKEIHDRTHGEQSDKGLATDEETTNLLLSK
eukprot:jgi/Psemu1/227060/e_gw1.1945.5.1